VQALGATFIALAIIYYAAPIRLGRGIALLAHHILTLAVAWRWLLEAGDWNPRGATVIASGH